ncbi:class I SAM-dependent methyltransferase [Anianabacter salinae]|uniref:class I SAM-dependent methyltransferase n=1 Tax=Anianabacter salinae TaxID=2851023 RepID=UPI00225E0165|nr:SAM-dependent methyltransferase [Anianabacter salinae]MBV0912616.1 SAM-dependent methyltransferase [Anianabacter salinae]
MTPLAALIARRIAATGPITLADYMTECLFHPKHGYYTTGHPIGRAGDFTTAPEISQMFGELVGLSLAQAWQDQGCPAPVALVEMGPGRGALMADALRATSGVPGFHDALRLHLVEVSPVLRGAQAAALAGPHVITFHDSIADVPEIPLLLIANEFFDALPVRQFQRHDGGWQERVVGLEGDRLTLGLTAPAPLAALEHRLADTIPGQIVETRAGAGAIAEEIGRRIADHGGAALIVDYGGWRSIGDTFQALKDHAPDDPFAHPGQADLTAHVDFEALAQAMPRTQVSAMTPQGVWLERLGITARAQALANGLTGAALDAQVCAHRRLTHPQEMGSLFKVISVTPHDASTLPGLGT